MKNRARGIEQSTILRQQSPQRAQQLQILRALWRLLAQDGRLLYTTCSVFHQENEQVIAAFLAQQPDARRLPISLANDNEGQLLPNDQHDGFFYALLQKIA